MFTIPSFRAAPRAGLSLLVLFALAPLQCGIAQMIVEDGIKATGAGSTGEDVEYESTEGAYRITCPPGWERRKGMPPPIDLAFFNEKDSGVNISVTWMPVETGRAELTKAMVEEMKETLRSMGYEITADEWRNVDGARAFCLSARFTPMGVELQNKQVMFVKGGKFYTLVYTTTPVQFMAHLGEFEKAVASFKTAEVTSADVIKSPEEKGAYPRQ